MLLLLALVALSDPASEVTPTVAPDVAPSPARLPAGERAPLVAVVLTPGRDRTRVAVTELLDALVPAVEVDSGVRVLSAEQAGADPAAFVACAPERRLSCWLTAALGRRPEGDPGAPRFVLVLSLLARAGEPDRASASILDVEAARQATLRMGPDDDAEDLIQIHAVRTLPGSASLASGADVGPWLEALVAGAVRPALEARGEWAPFGRVTVRVDRPVVVELDGRALGRVEPGATRVEELRSGRRALTFRPAEGEAVALSADVIAGGDVEVWVVFPSPAAGAARVVTLVGGAAVAAAGVGLMVWAAAASPTRVSVAPCAGAGCEGELPARWDDACTLTRDDPVACGPDRGLLIAPMGGALAVAGGTWAVGGLLGDPQDLPWIAWVAGAAAGALAYGVAAAVGP